MICYFHLTIILDCCVSSGRSLPREEGGQEYFRTLASGVSIAGDVIGLPELEERDFLDTGVSLSTCGKGCFCLDLCEQYYSDRI